MSVAAAQKQQAGFLFLLVGISLVVARLLSSASPEHTLTFVLGSIACILAFLNAEIAMYLLIIAMLLSPELDTGASTSGASLGRAVTLRVDDFLLLIICLTWFIKSVLYQEINLLKPTPLNGAMYFYSFAAILSTMLGMVGGNVDPKTGALFVLKYIEYFLVFWMAVNTALDEAQIRRFVILTLIVAVIVCVVAIGQIPRGGRVSAPFEGPNGEPNTLGGYLLLIMSISGALVLVDTPYRWPAAAVTLIAATAFTYTLSRASYLGLIPIVIILPFVTRRYFLLVGVIILGLLLTVFSQNLLPRVVYDRLNYTFTQTSTHAAQRSILGKRVDTSTSARLQYMEASVDAFMEKPILGWGVTGWHFLDSQYFRSLAETGLFGISALIFLLFRVIQVTLRSLHAMRDRDPFFFALAAGFLAGTAGLMMHAIGSNTFIIVRIMEPFWLLCALVYLLPSVTVPIVKKTA